MADIGSAAARGLESGFGMGLRLDAANEEKRARKFQEGRALESDRRADEELGLRRGREERAERRETQRHGIDVAERSLRHSKERLNELAAAATKARESGGPIPPEIEDEYQAASRTYQDGLNFFSRLAAGQEKLEDVDSGKVYMHYTAAMGRLPEEAPGVQQAINDVQAGLETGNKGLLIQGVNGVLAPQLKKGIGEPSPYGGVIKRKEIIGLDPARDANGRDHPDKFIPRLRVYVEHANAGPGPSGGGSRQDLQKIHYYDAPWTDGRSTGVDEKVRAFSIDGAMDTLGNLGVLMAAMQHPEVQAKLEEGAKLKGADARKYLDVVSRPTRKTTTRERVDLGDRVVERELDSTGKVVKETELKKGAAPRVFPPARGGSGASTMRAGLAAVDEALEAGEITEEEANEERRAIRSKIRPGAGGKGKGPSNAEQEAAVRAAVNAAANKMGLDYDANAKDFRNRDGSAVTPAQRAKIGEARTAASNAVRDAAAKGLRVGGTETAATATAAAKPDEKPKFEVGKPYTNSKGERAKYGGVDAEGKNIWLKP